MDQSLGADLSTRLIRKKLENRNVFERSIAALIENDEDQQVEFKETFLVNTTTGKKKDDALRYAALKEITGFLNTNDGVLLIGIRDKKYRSDDLPAVSGIAADGYAGDDDKYSRQIHDLVKKSLGTLAVSLVSIRIEEIGDEHVCRIECRKASQPTYCSYRGQPVLPFVRYGSSLVTPHHLDWQKWLEEKF